MKLHFNQFPVEKLSHNRNRVVYALAAAAATNTAVRIKCVHPLLHGHHIVYARTHTNTSNPFNERRSKNEREKNPNFRSLRKAKIKRAHKKSIN